MFLADCSVYNENNAVYNENNAVYNENNAVDNENNAVDNENNAFWRPPADTAAAGAGKLQTNSITDFMTLAMRYTHVPSTLSTPV